MKNYMGHYMIIICLDKIREIRGFQRLVAFAVAAAANSSLFTLHLRSDGLHVHRIVMRLLEHHVLDQFLGVDVLLHDLTLRVLRLAYDDTLYFWLEQHTTGGDGGGGDILGLGHADAGESYLEDAQTSQADLLSHLQEVLHGLAQFVEGSLDVAALQRCLALDESGDVVGLDEVLVIDGRCIILAVSGALGVVVLLFNVLLTHKENVKI